MEYGATTRCVSFLESLQIDIISLYQKNELDFKIISCKVY